jgi:hypothetical protein
MKFLIRTLFSVIAFVLLQGCSYTPPEPVIQTTGKPTKIVLVNLFNSRVEIAQSFAHDTGYVKPNRQFLPHLNEQLESAVRQIGQLDPVWLELSPKVVNAINRSYLVSRFGDGKVYRSYRPANVIWEEVREKTPDVETIIKQAKEKEGDLLIVVRPGFVRIPVVEYPARLYLEDENYVLRSNYLPLIGMGYLYSDRKVAAFAGLQFIAYDLTKDNLLGVEHAADTSKFFEIADDLDEAAFKKMKPDLDEKYSDVENQYIQQNYIAIERKKYCSSGTRYSAYEHENIALFDAKLKQSIDNAVNCWLRKYTGLSDKSCENNYEIAVPENRC